MRKNGFSLAVVILVLLILGVLAVMVVDQFIDSKSEKQEDESDNPYNITPLSGFNGFLITASYDDPDGHAYRLNQAVNELELRGYEIKTIVPCYYRPTNNQLRSIWVRVEKKEKAKTN